MKSKFEKLFVLDLANNHFGDFNHAKSIIKNYSKIIKKYNVNATIKFQFRDLDTFVHRSEIKNKSNKYVRRFLSTKFSNEQFNKIFKLIKKNKIKTSCTPFDEKSIDLIEKMRFDYLKIASVSSLDWSIIERSARNNIPKIISTGGKSLLEIDKIVSFMKHNNQDFALMHCVAIYPSENYHSQLSFIKTMRDRYKNVDIGWSTHENPNNFIIGPLSYACGANMFEKHVGIKSKKYKLNNYSLDPKNFEIYLSQMKEAFSIVGDKQILEKKIENKEIQTLDLLNRGVYLKNTVQKNNKISTDDVYFSFPKKKNQISSSEFSSKFNLFKAKKSILKDKPLLKNNSIKIENKKERLINEYIHQVKALLNTSNIEIGDNFDLEISHHYGVEKFKKVGCYLFNCINRGYAKKIVVQLAQQTHPLHKHKLKEETFQILSGRLEVELNSKRYQLYPGDTILIKPGVWHKFKSVNGPCIFEEISTTNYSDDSYYKDKKIKNILRHTRKTQISNWNTYKIMKHD